MQYRKLSTIEIDRLQSQGCTAERWEDIHVKEGFVADYVRDVQFSGENFLGVFQREFEQDGGLNLHSGIYNARLHNTTIEDDVYICKVNNYIANYTIKNSAFIENINLLLVDGETSFGNGVEVSVLNETAGRAVPIFDNLSSHLAYVLTLYRHNQTLIDNIKTLIADYAKNVRSSIGVIGEGVRIVNCGEIRNTKIGDAASLEGVLKLNNGSINSTSNAPTKIGAGVICEDFIVSSNTSISDSTLISRCFIGQGCEIGKHYSAVESLFFANCQAFHGEATAIFAGPYTVTHHKSTLLIAGMYSFFNAGSGSNQSNHMYKLGPIHQGIVERGSKTTSDSYILWPAKIGAFSLIMGRHYSNADTSTLPFSYLIENNSHSYLVPGVNIKTVGTVRDAQKWQKRDKRTSSNNLDQINFKLLNPVTVGNIMEGIDVLEGLKHVDKQDEYTYNNCQIKASSVDSGIKYYKHALTKYIGNVLLAKLYSITFDDSALLIEQLTPKSHKGQGAWVDVSGLIAPKTAIDELLKDIEMSALSLDDIQERFVAAHNNFGEFEWEYVLDVMLKLLGKDMAQLTVDDLVAQIENWKHSVEAINEMLFDDAKKEFNHISHIGFGVDGNNEQKEMDFANVRGTFETNVFANNCLQHTKDKKAIGDKMIERLVSL